MSIRVVARFVRFDFLLALLTSILIFTAIPANADDCMLVGNQLSCTSVFSTSGQSMFGLGQSEAIYHNTFGTSWNAGGSAGGIYNPTFLGESLGKYGAEVRASTSGNIGLTVDFRANGGTVNATAPAGVTLSLPDLSESYHPGDLITISSTFNPQALSSQNFGFTTQSPTLAASAQFGFRLAASAGATVCVVGCTGFNLGFDTGQQTFPIFSYNEALNGTGVNDIAINNSGLKIFGRPINTGTFQGDISESVGLLPGTWTVNADMSSAALTVATTSTLNGNRAVASETAQNPMLSTTVDAAKVLSNAIHVPLSSGSVGDLLPPGTPSSVKDIADAVEYTLLKANVGAGLALGQDFSMNAPSGAQITLDIKAGNVELPSVTFQAGQTVQMPMPLVTCSNGTCPGLTITPEITLNPLGFSASTNLTPQLLLGLQALGLSFAGLELGPLVDWNTSLNLGSVSLFSKSFGLGGFNSIDGQALTFNEVLAAPGTANINLANGIETVYYSYKNVSDNPALVLQSGSSLVQEKLVGSIMQPDAGVANGNVTMGPGTVLIMEESSIVSGIHIAATGGQGDANLARINSVTGSNVITDSTVTGNGFVQMTVAAGSSLALTNDTISGVSFNTKANVSLDQSSLSGTVMTLDSGAKLSMQSSSVTFDQLNITNGLIDVNGGSTLTSTSKTTGGSFGTAVINVGQDSTYNALQSGIATATLNVSSGGTANVAGFQNARANINGGELVLTPGPSSKWTLITLNTGTLSVNGSVEYDGRITGTGNLEVPTSANLLLGMCDCDDTFGPGSQLNIAGGLTINGAWIEAPSAVANLSGSLQVLEGGLELAQLTVESGGSFLANMDSIQTLVVGELRNAGTMTFDRRNGSWTPGAVIDHIVNTGQINVQNGTTYLETFYGATSFENLSGTVQVDKGAELNFYSNEQSSYVQQGGGTIINGTLATDNVVLNGGTLSGSGVVNGNVTNTAGTVQPGNSPGKLTINGNYTQGADGSLAIDINSLSAFDQLLINGNASLDGLLFFDVSADLFSQLTLGYSFDFLSLTNGTLSGQFSQVRFDYLGGDLPYGYGWDLVYGLNGVDLVWSKATDYGPLAIAFNEGDPLPTTFTDLPTSGVPPELENIILQNNPGVTLDDLNHATPTQPDYVAPTYTWQPTAPAVPEPGSLLLVLAGLAVGMRHLRRSS